MFDVVVVVKSGLINELLIKGTLKKEVEVRHESCIVTILVLWEERVQPEVDLLHILVGFLLLCEAHAELDEGNEGDTVEETKDSLL